MKSGPKAAIDVNALEGVGRRAVRHPGRTLVHQVNYRMRMASPFTVRYRGHAARAEFLMPESGGPRPLPLRQEDGTSVVMAPDFPIHTVIAFYV